MRSLRLRIIDNRDGLHMTTFDDREHAFEAHFALEEEQEFKAHARRDRLLGRWAGERLGLSGEALERYASSIVRADLRHPGEEDVFQKVLADLADKQLAPAPQDLRQRMDALLVEARRQVQAGER